MITVLSKAAILNNNGKMTGIVHLPYRKLDSNPINRVSGFVMTKLLAIFLVKKNILHLYISQP